MFNGKELAEFLGFSIINDNQEISKDQFNSIKPFIDSWSIKTYSADKKLCVSIIKIADGHIIARINRDETIVISLRSSILDALNLSAHLAGQAEQKSLLN